MNLWKPFKDQDKTISHVPLPLLSWPPGLLLSPWFPLRYRTSCLPFHANSSAVYHVSECITPIFAFRYDFCGRYYFSALVKERWLFSHIIPTSAAHTGKVAGSVSFIRGGLETLPSLLPFPPHFNLVLQTNTLGREGTGVLLFQERISRILGCSLTSPQMTWMRSQ